MIPAAFDYVRADSADEAIALIAEHGDDAKFLAGGMSLLPLMKLRLATPTVLVDVGRVARPVVRPRRAATTSRSARSPVTATSRPTTCSRAECGVLRGRRRAGRRQPGAPPRHDRRFGRARRSRVRPPGGAARARRDVRGAGPGRRAHDRRAPTSSRASSRPRSRPTSCSPRSACPKTGANGFAYEKFNRRAQDWAIVGAVAARVNGAHARRARQHGLDAAARAPRSRHALAQGASAADAAARRGRGHRAAGRPQRVARVPRAPRAGARPARARGALSATARRGRVLAAGPRRRGSAATSRSRCSTLGGRPLRRVRARRRDRRAGCAPVVRRRLRRPGRGRACRDGRRRSCATTRPSAGIASSLQAALARARAATPRSTRSSSASPTSRSSARTRTGGSRRAYDDGAPARGRDLRGVRGNPGAASPARTGPRRSSSTATRGRGCSCAATARSRYRATAPATRPTSTPPKTSPRWRHDGDHRQLPSEHARSTTPGRCCSTSSASRRACPARSCKRSRATSTAAS